MSAGFFARAGMLLGRGLAAFGLGTSAGAGSPTPTGAARLPTHVRLLSPARRDVQLLSPSWRSVRRLSPAFRKVQVLRG